MKKYLFQCCVLLLFVFLLAGCFRDPLFVSRRSYIFYKQPVYENPVGKLHTNGYYLQTGELHKGKQYRRILIFDSSGYVYSGSVKEDKQEVEIEELLHPDRTLMGRLHWYKVTSDSLQVEYFGTPYLEAFTSVFYQRGSLTSDTTLKLVTEDSPPRTYFFRFVPRDSLPAFDNDAMYADKKWYHKRLHPSRQKQTAP